MLILESDVCNAIGIGIILLMVLVMIVDFFKCQYAIGKNNRQAKTFEYQTCLCSELNILIITVNKLSAEAIIFHFSKVSRVSIA